MTPPYGINHVRIDIPGDGPPERTRLEVTLPLRRPRYPPSGSLQYAEVMDQRSWVSRRRHPRQRGISRHPWLESGHGTFNHLQGYR